MAVKSGSIKGVHAIADVDEGWGIRVDWEQEDNSYRIRTKTYLELRQSWSDLQLTNDRTGTTTIDGTGHSLFLSAANYGPAVMSILIGEGVKDVGSAKTITISSVLNMQWNLRGYNVTSFEASGSVTLDSIMEAPNAPTGVSLSLSGTTLNLSWSHSATTLRPVSDFEIQRSVNGGTWSAVTTTTSKSYSQAGSRGSSYKYRVRARNAAGNSVYVESGTVAIPYLAPNTPTLSTSQSGTTANLSWTITTSTDRPIDNFRIERSENGGSWTLLNSPSSGARSYADSGLARGSTYQYRIRAEGPGGDSGWSGTASERPPYLPPVAPSGISVSRAAFNRFVLSWSASSSSDSPIDDFDIYRSVNGGGFSWVASVGGSTRSWNDDTVELGKTYQYYVVANNVDDSTQSGNSNALTNPAGVPINMGGTTYNIYPAYIYDGASWVYRPVYVYNGSVWHWRG